MDMEGKKWHAMFNVFLQKFLTKLKIIPNQVEYQMMYSLTTHSQDLDLDMEPAMVQR